MVHTLWKLNKFYLILCELIKLANMLWPITGNYDALIPKSVMTQDNVRANALKCKPAFDALCSSNGSRGHKHRVLELFLPEVLMVQNGQVRMEFLGGNSFLLPGAKITCPSGLLCGGAVFWAQHHLSSSWVCCDQRYNHSGISEGEGTELFLPVVSLQCHIFPLL